MPKTAPNTSTLNIQIYIDAALKKGAINIETLPVDKTARVALKCIKIAGDQISPSIIKKLKTRDLKILGFLMNKHVLKQFDFESGYCVMEAVGKQHEAMSDRNFIIDVVKQHGVALSYVSAKLQRDKIVVIIAVNQNGLALRVANSALRGDKEVVTEAVKQDGTAILYTSYRVER